MNTNIFKFYKLEKDQMTDDKFKQIILVEKSGSEDCYTEDQLKEFFIESQIFDNFVCTTNNKIIAHITFNPFSKRRNGSIYMVNLIVLNEYRRKGIATKLIETACKYYLEKQLTIPMSLSVDKNNIFAINLYNKLGYKIVAPLCDIDIDGTQYLLEASLKDLYDNFILIDGGKHEKAKIQYR